MCILQPAKPQFIQNLMFLNTYRLYFIYFQEWLIHGPASPSLSLQLPLQVQCHLAVYLGDDSSWAASLLVQVQPIPHISVIQLGSSRIAAIGQLMLATQLWNRWKSMISNKLIYIELLYRHIWKTSPKNYANKGRHPVEWDCPLQLAFPNLGIPFHLLVTVIIIFLIQVSIWKESSSCKQGHTWWS